MHIIHLGKYYFPAVGGMESLIRSQAHAQAESGHKVEVVVINHLTPSGADVLGKSLGITQTSTENDGAVLVHRASRFGNIAKCDFTMSLRDSIRMIAKRKPDVWHLHTPNATMVLCLQGLLNQCKPLVVTHHSDIINQRVLRPAYNWAERRVYNRASLILSDSPNYIEGSRQLHPFLNKVDVLPIGIDVADYEKPSAEVLDWERRFRIEFGAPLWLCVGRLASYKALEVAIQALVNVPGKLAVIGVGPCEAQWKQLAVQLGVAERIQWLGRCSEPQLRGAYRAATALWFPSNARNEGFGIVQVESMASGCPVINTDIQHSGVSWVSQHERTGLTVPVNNAAALATAACRLLDEQGLRQKLSDAGKKRASCNFDQDSLNKQCIEFYEKAINISVNRQPTASGPIHPLSND